MGDHFVLLVDRLLTESTLESVLESQNLSMEFAPSAMEDTNIVEDSSMRMDLENTRCQGKLVQCRICHDEDEVSNMETPCSCCGSLKYAHCRCIQRWCNEKGNIRCEICLQQYKPGYTAPPALFRFGHIPRNFRGNWEISRRDLHSTTRIVRMVLPEQNFTSSNYEQYLAFIVFCSVAIIFTILLTLGHSLPLLEMIEDMEYSIPLLTLLLIRCAGFVLPVYVMVRAVTFMLRHRQQQRGPPNASGNQSDNENRQSASQPQPQTRVVRV